jgi:CelD/BcsL family acetyltransferase involved in cellulose biosynthesis
MKSSEVQVICSAEALSALAGEWNDLAFRCPGYFLSQTFQWAETAWETIGRPSGYKLNCLTLRSGGRLVAVWPLVICRDRGRLRTVRPLGFGGHEYCAPLVEPGDEAGRRVAILWRTAARSADLAVLRHVRADSLLAGILKAGRHWSMTEDAVPAPYVARADYPDWPAYHATISSRLRYEIRSRRRKLAKMGELVLERESAAGCAALIDWMLDQKKHWLVRSNLNSDWIDRPDSRDFLVALAAREDATGSVVLFALKLNGVPIAAAVVSIGGSRVEGYVTVYDLEWSAYSPGGILTEHIVQWAFEQGCDFDFRIGDQPYKFKWATRSCDTVIWQVTTSKRGMVQVRAALLLDRIRQKLALGRFLPSGWRERREASRQALAARADRPPPHDSG